MANEQSFHTGPLPGSEQSSTGLAAVDPNQVGAVAAVAREEAELKAAIVVARRFPRNETDAYQKIIKVCENGTFAGDAEYVFPRGDTQVDGLSIDFAREAARIWGNVRYGLLIVALDDLDVHIQGWAHDVETNTKTVSEDKFRKLVKRKGGWVKPDERDLRELINRRGAICVRNAILQILPSYLKNDAHVKVKATKVAAAAGTLKQDRDQAIRKMVLAFSALNVTVEMIETYLGHKMGDVTDEEFANLAGIGKSIRDGNSRREEHFTVAPRTESTGTVDPTDLKNVAPSDAPPRDHPSTQRAKEAEKKPAPVQDSPPSGNPGNGSDGAGTMFG